MILRCLHHHPKVRALLRGGGSCSPKPPVSSCGPPPVPHFLKHLVGIPAALSSRAAPGDPCSLTLHFLRNTCGLSEPAAAAAAARIHLRSTKRAHAVVALLRGLGLEGAYLAKVIATAPFVLTYRVDVTLEPKVDFLRRELGLTDHEICRIVVANPYRILCYSLARRLRPNYRLLRDLVGTDKNVSTAIKQSTDLIHGDVPGVLVPKIKILRDLGAPESVIVKLLIRHPKALMHRAAHFDETLAAMNELGIKPASGIFPYAFGLFSRLNANTRSPRGAHSHSGIWQRRMNNYISLGWTEEQVKQAFIRHPYCMSVSDDKVKRIWQFAEKVGWSPEYVSGSPMVLSLSYEKRLLPRYAVLEILALNGVFNGKIRISHLTLGEKKFVEKYVTSYQETIPQLLEAYRAATANAMNVKSLEDSAALCPAT